MAASYRAICSKYKKFKAILNSYTNGTQHAPWENVRHGLKYHNL
jgi:hypothetical protein